MTAEELKPGQRIFYRKGEYIFWGKHLQNKNLAYAKHEKTGIIKTITLKRVQLRNENQVN